VRIPVQAGHHIDGASADLLKQIASEVANDVAKELDINLSADIKDAEDAKFEDNAGEVFYNAIKNMSLEELILTFIVLNYQMTRRKLDGLMARYYGNKNVRLDDKNRLAANALDEGTDGRVFTQDRGRQTKANPEGKKTEDDNKAVLGSKIQFQLN